MAIAQDSSDPTGVVTDGANDKSALRARERKANAAIQLRVQGADWDTIAEVIGYPTGRAALVATERALEKEMNAESKDALRQLAAKRLDRLLRSVYPKAINPESPEHLPAIGRARELIADFRKLHGLDAPTEIAVHSPATSEIEDWVAGMVSVTKPRLEEDDIFDIDILEDEPAELEAGEG
jgi:hypothetical protein